VGKYVRLSGLRNETFNGRKGFCENFDFTTGRFLVKVDPTRTISVRPENVQIIKKKVQEPSTTDRGQPTGAPKSRCPVEIIKILMSGDDQDEQHQNQQQPKSGHKQPDCAPRSIPIFFEPESPAKTPPESPKTTPVQVENPTEQQPPKTTLVQVEDPTEQQPPMVESAVAKPVKNDGHSSDSDSWFDVDSEDLGNALKQAEMAEKIDNSAKDDQAAIANDLKVVVSDVKAKFAEQQQQLKMLGFLDEELNSRLLEQYGGNLRAVCQYLFRQ
jgi:hypothetical protein